MTINYGSKTFTIKHKSKQEALELDGSIAIYWCLAQGLFLLNKVKYMKFEDSPEYKKAKEEYNKRVFKNVLNPELVLPEIGYSCFDVLYLFYDSKYIDQIFNLFKQEYENLQDDNELTLPIHIGFQEPKLETKYIFGEERKCIMLWYDTQEEFMKDQITMFNKKQ